jgi:uncharacterized protein
MDLEDTSKKSDFEVGQVVSGVVDRFSPLGVNVQLNETTDGLIHANEVFRDLHRGEIINVYIKDIREDGKITLSLEKGGYKNFITDAKDTIMDALEKADGFLPFNDRSDPEEIQKTFQMSKKKFKETIGALYKEQKIQIRGDGIKIISNE